MGDETITILSEAGSADVPGRLVGGSAFVAAADLPAAIGWTLKPEGLCRGDVCVPVRGLSTATSADEPVDLVVVAGVLDRPVVVDGEAGVVAVGAARSERRAALDGRRAPAFRLPDLDGVERGLDDWAGQKKVLVAFSSWCGCAYDLPGWQALQNELGDGAAVVAVAIDESADDVRPFTDGLDLPVLVDREHLLTELYAISNVPTVLWIDEADNIVRPNSYAFGTDVFAEITGVESGPHLDRIRKWVATGEVDDPGAGTDAVGDLSPDEQEARLWFRIAAHLRRAGREPEAASRFARAVELAPWDFTVRRAAMPLTGRDPFGDEFLAWYAEWQEAGQPYHGLPADRD